MSERRALGKRMAFVALALAGLAGVVLCVPKPTPPRPPVAPPPPARAAFGFAPPGPVKVDVIGALASRPLTSWEHPLPGGGVRDGVTGELRNVNVFVAVDPARLPHDPAGRAEAARIAALSAKTGDDVPTIPFRRSGH